MEYDDCNIYSPSTATMIVNCSSPSKRKRFTMLFEPFQSIPNVPEYREGQRYYFISEYLILLDYFSMRRNYRNACVCAHDLWNVLSTVPSLFTAMQALVGNKCTIVWHCVIISFAPKHAINHSQMLKGFSHSGGVSNAMLLHILLWGMQFCCKSKRNPWSMWHSHASCYWYVITTACHSRDAPYAQLFLTSAHVE